MLCFEKLSLPFGRLSMLHFRKRSLQKYGHQDVEGEPEKRTATSAASLIFLSNHSLSLSPTTQYINTTALSSVIVNILEIQSARSGGTDKARRLPLSVPIVSLFTQWNLNVPAPALDANQFLAADPPGNVTESVTTSGAHSLTVVSALSKLAKSNVSTFSREYGW